MNARSKFRLRKQNAISLTPLERVIRDIQTKTEGNIVLVSRKQFPCLVAEAITIHKAQGQTYDQVVIDMSRKMNLPTFYTSLSRAKSLNGLFLMGEDIIFPTKRPDCHPVSEETFRLKNDALLQFGLRFPRLVIKDGLITTFFQNLPYLRKHADDLATDINVRACDLLALVETRSENIMISGFDLLHSLDPVGTRPFGISLYGKSDRNWISKAENNIIFNGDDSHIERMRIDFGSYSLFIFYVSPNFPKSRALTEISNELLDSLDQQVIAVGDWKH